MNSKCKTIVMALSCAVGGLLFGNSALAVGALAIDGNHGKRYGFSYDYPDTRQAVQRALRECGSGCRVVLKFETGCGAYAIDQAAGSSVYGWATSSSKSTAQSNALDECYAHGGTSCIIRVWGCNSR